jgi:hypothetical protein
MEAICYSEMSLKFCHHIPDDSTLAYFHKTSTVEIGNQPLLCSTQQLTVGRGVFCAIRADDIWRGPAAITSESRDLPETQLWANLRGREPGSRGTSTVEDITRQRSEDRDWEH